MLVSRRPIEADPLQPGPYVRAGLAGLFREPQAQRAVGIAEPEPLDQLGVRQPPRRQILQRLRRLFERLVIIADHLIQQRRIVGIEGHRRRQSAHRATHRR